MKVRLTLFGDLRQYLPPGSQFNHTDLELAQGVTLSQVLQKVALPEDKSWMLTLNGDLVREPDYAVTTLNDGDEVVLFPPIKGG
ncbi:MAG: MoaD/ThiS family protein [Thiolinea sp.]